MYYTIQNSKAIVPKIAVYLFRTFTVGAQIVILESLSMINGAQNYIVVASVEIGRGIIGPWTIKIKKKDCVGTSFYTLRDFCPFFDRSIVRKHARPDSDQSFITHSPILWF